MNEQPLIAQSFKLQRYPGKGGWTYVAIPDLPKGKKTPFRWRRVKGTIDNYEFKNYHLMPIKNGGLFFPVKSEIRKKIGKFAGDTVKIILFEDLAPLEIPDDVIQCLKDEPKAYEKFLQLSEAYQKEFVNWISSAKKEETRASRILGMITLIMRGKTLSKN